MIWSTIAIFVAWIFLIVVIVWIVDIILLFSGRSAYKLVLVEERSHLLVFLLDNVAFPSEHFNLRAKFAIVFG